MTLADLEQLAAEDIANIDQLDADIASLIRDKPDGWRGDLRTYKAARDLAIEGLGFTVWQAIVDARKEATL